MPRTGRPRVLADVSCRVCGVVFHPPVSTAKFCSQNCYQGSLRRRHPDKMCPSCKTMFRPRPTAAVYCSRQCYGLSIRGKPSGREYVSKAAVMSPTEAAWLGGLLDGEGSIMWANRKVRATSCLRVTVTNTCPALLERVYATVCTGSIVAKPSYSDRHRPSWHWQVHGETARSVLQQILPWLTAKHEQAEMAIRGEIWPVGHKWW